MGQESEAELTRKNSTLKDKDEEGEEEEDESR
jgi:hypothetical protein